MRPNHTELAILLCLLVLPRSMVARGADNSCKSDDECQSHFNSLYRCDQSSHTCHRLPLYESLGPRQLTGLALNLFFNILANAIGVSSGGMVFCFLIICLQLTAKDTIAILKVGNLFAAGLNIAFVLARRRAGNKDELYMDFELGAFTVALVLSGCMAGLLVNQLLPSAVLCAVMFATLLIFVGLTWRQTRRIRQEEAALDQPALSARTWGRTSSLGAPDLTAALSTSAGPGKPLFAILAENGSSIFLMTFATTLTVFGNLAKGSASFPSVLQVHHCSAAAFGLYAACCVLTAAVALPVRKGLTARYNPQAQLKIALCAFLAGMLISVGITGSLAFTSLLVILGIEPAVVAAVSNFMLFFTSAATIVQFQVAGYLDLTNAVFIGLFALAGALLGNLLMWWKLGRAPGSQAIIAYILVVVLLLTIVVFPLSVYQEYLANAQFLTFGSLC